MNSQYLLGLCCLGIILSSTHLKAAADRFEACAEEYEKRHFSVLQNKRTSPKYRRIITSLQYQGEETVERELKKQRSKERAKLIALRKLRGAWRKISLLDENEDTFVRRVFLQTQHKPDMCERERNKALSKMKDPAISRKRHRRTMSE
jgi:hypothetical protein